MGRSFAASVAVALLAIPVSSPAGDRPVASRWAASPVLVDGAGEEWREDARNLPSETPVGLAFRNDGRNLYILFEFHEPIALGTVGNTGLALFRISPQGGRRIGGTRFTVRTVSADRFVELLEKQGRRLSDRDRVEIRMRAFYPVFEALAISGKGKVLAEPVLPGGEEPAEFKVAQKGRVVIYEIRLPLGSWAPAPGTANPAAGDAVSLEFEWGGPVLERKDDLPNGLPGVPLLHVISPNSSPLTAQRTDPRFKRHTIGFTVKLADVPS